MKKILITLIFGLITVLNYAQEKSGLVGDQAYNFIGMDEKGNEIQISDYKGKKYILLNFTATWCGPCWKTYIPMNEIQDTYMEELKVISFHIDDTIDMWKEMSNKAKIKFKCTSIWKADNKSEIQKIYNPDGLPYFYLIDKDGVIIEKWSGNNKGKLKRMIKKHI